MLDLLLEEAREHKAHQAQQLQDYMKRFSIVQDYMKQSRVVPASILSR